MTTQEKKLITALALKEITKNEFLIQYPVDLIVDKNYALRVLEEAYINKDADAVEYSLLLGFLFDTFSNDYVDVLCKLILENWHYKHEDIALILQELKNPKSVDSLYDAALMKFEYLSYDDSYALARKCIHALGDINTEYSRDKLMLLAASDVNIIREKAEKQLHYYKR